MKTLDKLLTDLRQQGVTLWLEGDRLRYRSPEGALTPDLIAELKSRKSEILAFLQQVNTASTASRPPLVATDRSESAPLSFAQQRFWLLHQFEPDSSDNNMPVVLRLRGKLNIPALEQSLQELVRRHEILRTIFPVIDGEPRQVIAPEVKISLPVVDLRSLPAAQKEAEALRLATEIAQAPFNLATGPMLNVSLFHLADDEYLFIWSIHCITGDGSSSDIFYQELTALYAAFSAGQPSPLPELPVQYADFAEWQRTWLQGEVLEKQLEYWKQQLSGSLSALQLPTDHPRPPVQTFRGDRCPRMFSKQLHSELLKLSQKTGTTLFMVLLAAFETLLFRYSGQEDLLISFTNAGRNQVETEKMIGFFSGTLLLRTNFAGNPSFREILHQVREEALEAYAHQDLPFEKLVEELRPEQNQSRSPLFQIKFALNPPWTNGRGMSSVYLPELTIESLFGYIYHGKTKFDLILVMREQEQGLGAVFDYNADLFDLSTAERMMDHFQTLLEAIVANPDQTVLELPLLNSDERQRQLVSWQGASVTYPRDYCIQQLFSTQVEQNPEAIAVIAADTKLTYRDLDQRSSQLAAYLLSSGITAEDVVGVYLERSPLFIIALLGILKAGGAYVALEPTTSSEQLLTLAEAVQATMILTQSSLIDTVTPAIVKAICLDADQSIWQWEEVPAVPVAAEQIACIRHEPTAAGQFRGLQISHRGIVHLAQGGNYATLGQGDVVLHHTPLTNPAALFEIWGSLLNGATLVLAPAHPLLPENLADWIQNHAITTLWLPTRLFHRLVDEHLTALQSVRQLLTGGDILSVSQVQTLLQSLSDCQLSYVYSAPGSTAFTCCHPIAVLTQTNTAIPIGTAIANTQTYVLNQQGQPVPVNVPGELYIGGDGLGLGYLNQPEGASQAFVPDFSDAKATRLYKTGELVRCLPDGQLEWIGTVDRQVRIQGWRVELARVETILSQHSAIHEALVIASEDLPNDECIVAYVVLKQQKSVAIAELRNHLRHQLPLLMLPAHFVFLDALPLTAQGEIDYSSLPHPQGNEVEEQPAIFQDSVEHQLAQIWTELFGIQSISVHDNFFDLGGDSLLAVRLFAHLEQVFDKKLPLSVLLSAPTIAQLAELLRQEDVSEAWSPLVVIQSGNPAKTPLFCIHGMGFNVLIYRKLAANLDPEQPVYGLQARGLDGNKDRISDRLEEMAADYIKQVQTIQPHGPYQIAGLSNGGNIALEMAQQFLAQGEAVALVAMFDTFGPDSVKLLAPLPRFLSSLKYFARFSLHRFVCKFLQNPAGLITKIQHMATITDNTERDLPIDEATKKLRQAQQSSSSDSPVTKQLNSTEYWMERFSEYVLHHSSWSFLPKHLLKDIGGSLSETIKEMEEAYSKIQAAYRPSVYPGKIVLFRASESPPGYHLDPLLGWRELAQDGVEVHIIPGNHTSIVESKVLAKKLELCMNHPSKAKTNSQTVI